VGANPVTFPNLASSARNLRGIHLVLLVALLLLGSVILGYLSAHQAPGPARLAAWWPAAGINVVAAVAVTRRHRPIVLALIAITTLPVLLSAGRPVGVAIAISIAMALEALIVTQFSVNSKDRPRLTTMTDVIRFFSGALIGAAVIGIAAGGASALFIGRDFFDIAFATLASHASAIAVIAPIALVSRLKKPNRKPLTRLAHAILLTLSILVSFAPGSFAPLSFLPVPFLAWAAFTFSMAFALVELIGAAALVVVLTGLGGGAFATSDHAWLDSAALMQLYALTLSVTTLLIAAARNERMRLEEKQSATARLLHEGFEQSHNGFAMVQKEGEIFRVMEVNSASLILLETSFRFGQLIDNSALHHLFIQLFAEEKNELVATWDEEDSIPVTITVTRAVNARFGEILLMSVVDLRPVRAAEAAMQMQLDREQAVVEELRALNQQKDDFVSSVTHELRTPITTITGFSDELEQTPLDEEQKAYLAIVQRNAMRLQSVVEDVLTFSRRMPQAAAPGLVDVDFVEIISSTLDDLRHSICDKRITVTNTLPAEPLLVVANANDLTRVVINLLTNAVKFTPMDGTLDLSALVENGGLTITIVDSGPGIDPKDIEKVFDPFYRASRSAHDGVPGTGLGLSIVRDLVTHMNGQIALESDGIKGTTARLTLPLSAGVPAVA